MPEPRPGTDTEWARWLREALAARGWSAADLARTGVVASESTISKWLRSENPPKLVETVIEVAHLLGAHDATEALDAAGMRRAADMIRAAQKRADTDPVIAQIQSADDLTQEERAAMIENYRRTQQETIHYFELQIAEASRLKRAARDKRTGHNGGQRAAQ